MKKITLNQEQIFQLIKNNQFTAQFNKITCRCIDGRYKNKAEEDKVKKAPAALTIPGADIGQIAIIFASANNFGFEINKDKLLKTYKEFLGGWHNFHYHSDDHHSPLKLAAGCGYYNLIKNNPDKFYLQDEDINFIDKQLVFISQQSTQEILHNDHDEGAIVLVKGEVGIYPRHGFTVKSDGEEKKIEASVFIFNQTLFNHRQKILAKKMINGGVVKLFSGLDEEYLAFTLIETAEVHLFETLNQLAKGLPIYQVIFDEKFDFQVKLLYPTNSGLQL